MDKQKELFISPINKIKRILLHFAELLLVFMVGFTIVNAVVFPIANNFFKVEDRISSVDDFLDKKMDILYDHQLLFYEKENDKYDISKSLNYTFDLYLESYVLAKPDQNVIDNYFFSTLKDEELYFEIYSAADKDYQFFSVTNIVTLKQEFIDLFSPYFSTTNSLSIVGKEKLEIFKNKIFINIYNFILNNIESHNLISEISGTVYSYNDIIYSIERINTEINYYFSIGTIIGFLITILFYYVIFPCFFGNRRTIGMVLMRVQLLNKNKVDIHNRSSLLLNSLVSIPTSLSLIFLLPTITTGFESAFTLPILIPLSLIGILFAIVSLVFLLFNNLNQTLSDFVSNSVIINNDDYDSIIYERSIRK